MKKLLLLVSLVGLAMASQSASADHWRGYRGGFGGAYNPYHYGYRDFRRGSYVGFGYGRYTPRYRYRHRYDTGSFVGGLVLGSLLSSPRYSRRHYDRVRVTNTPVVRTRTVVREVPASSSPVRRRLLRDLDGNCFEVNRDEAGNEVRVQLDASACQF